MTKQNFEKEKLQIWYIPKFTFTSDNTVTENAKKLIEKLKNPDDWNFVGAAKKDGLDRITTYKAPVTHNGHVESEGWSWQADVETMGSGSKARLVLACKPNNIKVTEQKAEGEATVGKDKYKIIKAHIEVVGKFRYIPDSKK